jgi:GNAT superfamily N-acetyltransferase
MFSAVLRRGTRKAGKFSAMPLSAPEPLNAAHDVTSFSCGKPALDHWLRTRALANQEKGFTVVMVVHDAGRVVGYYGLAPTAVVPTVLPRSIKTGQLPNPVPCLLLGQLASDHEWAGQGIGTGLLRHALIRCVQGARLIGGRALMVNAIDPEAASFWQRRGFLPSKDDPLILFRSIADIAASLLAAGIEP